jgi:hypothetical protein
MVLVLVFSACGGRSAEPEPEGQGLAALGESPPPTGGTKAAHKDAKGGDKGGDKGAKGHPRPEGNGGRGQADGGDGGDDDGSAPSGTSGNAPSGNKAAPRGPQVAAAVPIPTGTHSYDTDGSQTVSGNTSRMPKTTTLTARAAREGEQTQIRDLRDSDGNGTVVETRLLYRDEGVYITYVKITASFPGGFTDVRELQPAKPELIAPTGAEPGAKTSFLMSGSGTRADVDVAAKRFQDVTIGGTTVRTLVVDTKIVFSGAIEGQQSSTTWFWGKHVMAVREAVATDVSSGPIRVQSQYQALLTRLP